MESESRARPPGVGSWFLVVWLVASSVAVPLALINGDITEALARGLLIGLVAGVIAACVSLVRSMFRAARNSETVKQAAKSTGDLVASTTEQAKNVANRLVDNPAKRYDALAKLKALRDSDAITDDEYAREKRALLRTE